MNEQMPMPLATLMVNEEDDWIMIEHPRVNDHEPLNTLEALNAIRQELKESNILYEDVLIGRHC